MYVKICSHIESLIESNNLVTENVKKENLEVPSAATLSTDIHYIPTYQLSHIKTLETYFVILTALNMRDRVTFSAKDMDCNTD
jgi:hypothetical protein